jgi:hypothetical protein
VAGPPSLCRRRGAYLNFETDTDDRRVRASYGREKYRRLAALKAEWDPSNMFQHNPNIPPGPDSLPAPRHEATVRADKTVH